MTRNEYIEALRPLGVRNMKRMTLPQLAAKYAELASTPSPASPEHPASPEPPAFQEPPAHPGPPPVLYFNHAGWCPALAASYFIGYFHPATWAEYRALKPYASQPPR